MAETRTDAIRAFHNRVHLMNNANQRDLRLTAQEARNLSNELAQVTALLLESEVSGKVEVSMLGAKF
jgi:hypothetical protein